MGSVSFCMESSPSAPPILAVGRKALAFKAKDMDEVPGLAWTYAKYRDKGFDVPGI
jgi:hypothetical protein